MDINPVFWTILGEVGVVTLVVLIAIIVVISRDRKKLTEYAEHLKFMLKELRKKLAHTESEQAQQSQERVLVLLNSLIEYLHEQYKSTYADEAGKSEAEDKNFSIDKFLLVSTFQTLVAQRNALDNSNNAQDSWEKIKDEITPLIQNYLNPFLPEIVPAQEKNSIAETEEDENLKAQLENANQRINNLEKFKQLYFDLQNKLGDSLKEIELLNQKILSLAEGSESFAEISSIIEMNKTHYITMGQMIGMDKEQHHESVADNMDYSDEIINERKDEIKRLKHQIAQQFEDIWELQNRISNPAQGQPEPAELHRAVETISGQLKDAEMCIETMDMEIETMSSEILNLKRQLKKQQGSGSDDIAAELEKVVKEKDQLAVRSAQESKELMSCITGLEDGNSEQTKIIQALEEKLKANKEIEEKYIKLEADYSSMEEKYLQAVSGN